MPGDELEDRAEALALNHDTFSRNTRTQLKQVLDALRERMTPPAPPLAQDRHHQFIRESMFPHGSSGLGAEPHGTQARI
ncbi:hypothetical protein H5407_19900 [Mitsuaria sp. WAJ17]|uniref:hypothetical protein n=1 Tax=Mitsuaria sp. WAJ17 TaxID=2761452 RepID=UPI0016007688|nr:hypothetical protein [Mitsuaria sp. WAJ17]MBB2487504.1 hypothetical protein [Mitsuaria sp. WAJ17]